MGRPKKPLHPSRVAAQIAGEKFFIGDSCKRGHSGTRYTISGSCVECGALASARCSANPKYRARKLERNRKYREENPEQILAYQADYYQRNKERYRVNSFAWHAANPDKAVEYSRAYYARSRHDPEMRKRYALKTQMRKRRVRQAQPVWVDQGEIFNFYVNAPEGMTVDHAVPLKGVNQDGEHVVCGLHVPWNLQYLTPSENSVKNNKWPYPGVPGRALTHVAHFP